MKDKVKLTLAERKKWVFNRLLKEMRTFEPGRSVKIPYFTIRWLHETPESLAEALGSQFIVTQSPGLVIVTRKAKVLSLPTEVFDSYPLEPVFPVEERTQL